ncbi:MAG TPA: hypothetical protein VJK47_01410, partial [Dehalococcoidales bacterium]|nr:hypothetical protein [Dehalococcoidales bacterium]
MPNQEQRLSFLDSVPARRSELRHAGVSSTEWRLCYQLQNMFQNYLDADADENQAADYFRP